MKTIPLFELILDVAPSFHRSCTIRIEGEVNGGLATFEACAIGLLPRMVLTLAVDAGRMATLHDCCANMLAGWDERWSQSGLDGIGVHGVFDSSDSTSRAFALWSPEQGSAAYAMISATLDCFPFGRCSGAAGELLEIVRSYFELQPPVTVTGEAPLRLRLAPWLNARDANEIARSLSAIAEDRDLIVDASGIERFRGVLPSILPMGRLLKRTGVVRWVARGVNAEALIQYGVEPSTIEIVQRAPISSEGHPIVLGGLVITSPELIAIANNGTRIELVRALRREYRLTIEQASKAGRELFDILAANPIS